MAAFAGKSVAITGAGGSIGSEICRQAIAGGARRLVLVSLTEGALYNIERELRHSFGADLHTELVPVLGSVADPRLMLEVLTGVDIVIHAAAHKHVPLCEKNPLAAIQNNVGGSHSLMIAARARGVAQFCLISTDKAVNPSSIMGATKRLAELLIIAQTGVSATRFFTVRFGNVLGSAGSVIPLWREQIIRGGPVTLTDARCERYFMSIRDAVTLIMQTLELAPASGTYVLDMGPQRRLLDMAHELIETMQADVEIQLTGLRPGEKLTEELHHGGELEATGIPRLNRVQEAPRALLDMALVSELTAYAGRRDRKRAVDLLWELIA